MGKRVVSITLASRLVKIAAQGEKVANALREITVGMDLYHGARLSQVLDAVYDAGRRDGAKAAFESIDSRLAEVKSEIPHRLPGRPKRR